MAEQAQVRYCVVCQEQIDPERLEAKPEAVNCITCARKFPEPLKHDPNVVCAQASPSGQNGWSSRS